ARQAVPQVAKKTLTHSVKKTTQKVAPKAASNTRGWKSPKKVEQIGKYTRETWTKNANRAGPPARAEYVKIKVNNITRTMYKDTYNKNNKLLHRKYKVCRGRPC